MNIRACFERYLETKATAAYLENEIQGLEKLLQDEEFIREQLEADALPGTVHEISGQHLPSDRTGRLGQRLLGKDPTGIRALIGGKRAQQEAAIMATARADALLSALCERERFVIEKHLIESLTWSEVTKRWEDKTREYREWRSLQRLERTAMKKLQRVAGEGS